MSDACKQKEEGAAEKLRVLVMSSGSRGDIQPYCALACALRDRGHDVTVACEERVRPLVDSFGLRFHLVRGDPTEVLHSPEGAKMLSEAQFMKLMKVQGESAKKWWAAAAEDYTQAAVGGVDVVVSGPLCLTQGWCIAEYHGARFVPLLLGPTLRTADFPLHFISHRSLGGWLNRRTYDLVFAALWSQEKARINAWRQDSLKLAPLPVGLVSLLEHHRVPTVVACSTAYFPNGVVPADYPPEVKVPGFFFVPPCDDVRVPPAVRAFVEAESSKPLVCVGFGSMPAEASLVEVVTAAAKTVGARMVLLGGWSRLPETPESADDDSDVLVATQCPHDWLFERVRVAVHHCGIGTTAAGLRAGVVVVPCPVMLDQPFTAARLHSLGVGTAPLPFAQLTAETLGARLSEALCGDGSQTMRARAREVQATLATESNALQTTCESIEAAAPPDYANAYPASSCAIS